MKLGRHHHRIHAFTAFVTMAALVLTISSGFSPTTYADWNHNPLGVLNYCSVNGNTTTIYGWAHDGDAPAGNNPAVTITVGTASVTVPTNVAGYRDTAINRYLDANRPSTPQGHTYGFAASFTNLYKGTSYGVSGKALNVGAGTNDIGLLINTDGQNVDGIPATPQFTAAKTVPDACLVARPVVPNNPGPSTPTTPTPSTPTPTPSPEDESDDYDEDYDPAADDAADAAAVAAAEDADETGKANATVSSGTLSASVTVPAEGAKSVYVLYGTSEEDLTESTENVGVEGDKANLKLTYLEPKTKYFYQVVRTDASGKITTSPVANFETAGFAVTLHFIDSAKKAVSGIEGVIDDNDSTEATSDKKGDLKFFDLEAGVYAVKFEYKDKSYTKEFDTNSTSSESAENGKAVVLSDTVNVSTLKGGAAVPGSGKKSSVGTVLVLLFLILLVAGIIIWLLIRRKRRAADAAYTAAPYSAAGPGVIDLPTAEAPAYSPVPLPIKPTRKATEDTGEPLEHVGESLREMVVRSMHEEAQKRKQDQ